MFIKVYDKEHKKERIININYIKEIESRGSETLLILETITRQNIDDHVGTMGFGVITELSVSEIMDKIIESDAYTMSLEKK